jgi:hypothetical protein
LEVVHPLADSKQIASELTVVERLDFHRDVNAALNLAALAQPTHEPGPYREFLGKGETPVERGALAHLPQDG